MSGGYCELHDMIVSDGLACPYCVQAERRQALNVLEARIADQDTKLADQGDELRDLRRQVNELRHIVLDVQRAHNLAQQPRMLLVQPAKFGKWCAQCALYTTADTPGVRCSECGT